ncbi:Transcription antitermination protein RfaH [Polaromonas vacuolata]|uniref:Transcription antitermination protein RfaH n=1 Tax=Polaromonas vacuolata TaxID=37448 RepID=A0A6H2H7F1_9BURK|nr:transcription termination/antitermination NusG family protein [Polaromonas vacuolata]QJC55760.1 Transcription antitermination protein RfaH [Polaromonas vacuolata]
MAADILHPETDIDIANPKLVCADKAWFLAWTRPRLEIVAEQNLRQQEFDVYLPLYKSIKKNETGNHAVFEPMFPRYIFFRPSSVKQSIALVRSSRGVGNVVSFGHIPATISADTLTAIRLFEQVRNTTDIEKLNPIRKGAKVKFFNPAFEGIEGLIQSISKQRVTVLLEILGRQQVLTVTPNQIKLAA